MFFLQLPAGIWFGTFIPSIIIASYREDDRSFGAACILLALAPFALVYGILALKEGVTKIRGGKAFWIGFAWNLSLVVAMTMTFLVLVK